MNRLELVERVAARTDNAKAAVDRIVVATLEEIIAAVREGQTVTLIGFGSFKSVTSSPRKGRNPATGENIAIPETKKPKFIPGAAFRELLSGKR